MLPIPAALLYDDDPDRRARQRAFRERLRRAAGMTVGHGGQPGAAGAGAAAGAAGNPADRHRPAAAGAIPEPAEVTAAPGTHNLPRRLRGCSSAAHSALGQLRGALAGDASAVVTQAVYGLGGVGKSELALQHAEACRAEYA